MTHLHRLQKAIKPRILDTLHWSKLKQVVLTDLQPVQCFFFVCFFGVSSSSSSLMTVGKQTLSAFPPPTGLECRTLRRETKQHQKQILLNSPTFFKYLNTALYILCLSKPLCSRFLSNNFPIHISLTSFSKCVLSLLKALQHSITCSLVSANLHLLKFPDSCYPIRGNLKLYDQGKVYL